MNRQASAVFLGRGFAWQPSVQNLLALSLPWWQHLQSASVVGKGVTENQQRHFANQANKAFAH